MCVCVSEVNVCTCVSGTPFHTLFPDNVYCIHILGRLLQIWVWFTVLLGMLHVPSSFVFFCTLVCYPGPVCKPIACVDTALLFQIKILSIYLSIVVTGSLW